jgi:hypothetical protein
VQHTHRKRAGADGRIKRFEIVNRGDEFVDFGGCEGGRFGVVGKELAEILFEWIG